MTDVSKYRMFANIMKLMKSLKQFKVLLIFKFTAIYTKIFSKFLAKRKSRDFLAGLDRVVLRELNRVSVKGECSNKS